MKNNNLITIDTAEEIVYNKYTENKIDFDKYDRLTDKIYKWQAQQLIYWKKQGGSI